MIALIITCYNRSDYVRRCFSSLEKADLTGVKIIVVDDASTEEMPDLPGCEIVLRHSRNSGIKSALYTGIMYAMGNGCREFINLDSDAIVDPDFVPKLIALKRDTGAPIVSGFRTHSDGDRPTRRSCNGINMYFDMEAFHKYISPALQVPSYSNWDFDATKTLDVPICNPGVIQHIGYQSSMGHDGSIPDHSPTLKEFHLPDVTLVAVDSRPGPAFNRALAISKMNIAYGSELVVTDHPITFKREYSHYIIKELPGLISTSHALIIQHDGYVLRPEAWNPKWLGYDYIGAPWEWYKDEYKVGNGGFSLRSKKLMDLVLELAPNNPHPEDDVICRQLRPELEKRGIKFAPLDVARKFSIEGYQGQTAYSGQFGFHGSFANLSSLPRFLHLNYHRPRAYARSLDRIGRK